MTAAGRKMEERMPKPIPVPNELSQPYWEAVNSGKLALQYCKNCNRYYHPPVGLCANCQAANFEFKEPSGKGKIHSYTITHDARQPAFEALQPYPVAVVELDDQPGLFMLSNLPGAKHEDIKVGKSVELTFEDLDGEHKIPQFQLAK